VVEMFARVVESDRDLSKESAISSKVKGSKVTRLKS
jgi:hypothetical protein